MPRKPIHIDESMRGLLNKDLHVALGKKISDTKSEKGPVPKRAQVQENAKKSKRK